MSEEIAFADWSKRLELDRCAEQQRGQLQLADADHNGGECAADSCSWLPAYGFHQPAALQQAFLHNKAVEFYSNDMADAACSTNALLETIVEETSDDLCSETSESDYNSGLLTDSVSTIVHVPSYRVSLEGSLNSFRNDRRCNTEINTDPGVQDDDDDEDDFTDEEEDESENQEEEEGANDDISEDSEDGESDERRPASEGFPTRTNSLLQFEKLEKHYESIFQTRRTTCDLYDLSGVFENRTRARSWRFKSSSQPENLNHFGGDIDDDNNDSSSLSSSSSSNSSSSLLSSDEIPSSCYSSKYDSLSRRLSLRSFRSIDSLTSLHQKHEKELELVPGAELSQSLDDNMCKVDKQPADEGPVAARGFYKTMECLSQIPGICCDQVVAVVASAAVTVKVDAARETQQHQTRDPQPAPKMRRSTENLSEDSGFGDHITKESSSTNGECGGRGDSAAEESVAAADTTERIATRDELVEKESQTPPPPPLFEAEGGLQNVEATISAVGGSDSYCWQSDPNLSRAEFAICQGARCDAVSACEGKADVVGEYRVNAVDDSRMASRQTVASTPNLYRSDEGCGDNRDDDSGRRGEYRYRRSNACDSTAASDCNDSTVSLSRAYSLKRINFASESELSATSCSRSRSRPANLQIMTSFVSVTSRGADDRANGGDTGVHFCPVVAEVNLAESYCPREGELKRGYEDDEEDGCGSGEYEMSAERSPWLGGRFSWRSAPAVNALLDKREREFSLPLNTPAERLLTDSASSAAARRDNRELQERARQRTRINPINYPPPPIPDGGSGSGGGGRAGGGGGRGDGDGGGGGGGGSGGGSMSSSSSSRSGSGSGFNAEDIINSGKNDNKNNIADTSASSSSLNESTSSPTSWSSPTRTNASYLSVAFDGAMDSSVGGASDSSGGVPAQGKPATASPTKSSPVGKLGGFFQRFSLKRLSGRKSKKTAATVAPPVVVCVVPKSGGSTDNAPAAGADSRLFPPTSDYDDAAYAVSDGQSGQPRGDQRNYADYDVETAASIASSVVSCKPPLPPIATPAVATLAAARRRPFCDIGGSDGLAQAPFFVDGQRQPERQSCLGEYGVNVHTPTMPRKTAVRIDRRSPPPSSSSSSSPLPGLGLLETDLDSNVTLSTGNVRSNGVGDCSHRSGHAIAHVASSPANSQKSRSLLNLDNGRLSLLSSSSSSSQKGTLGGPPDAMKTAGGSPHHGCNDYRAKSMEFLLDKENQAAVKAPENELQKGGVGERKMSEHELRVQRSLQKLNVPEWYKNSAVPSQGFLLKRHNDAGQSASPHLHHQHHHHQQQHQRWNANTLPSKTTSLSSLGPNLSIAPTSPTASSMTSPGHAQYSFSRWSTSRLNSGTNSSNTSPCSSARSSFNYRQPYLGWRSQEKLSKPRTPAERLAAGILPQRTQAGSQQSSPSLTEVRSSIKEVTSAIVHYVSGARDTGDRLSPSLACYTADGSSRSTSPRGSAGRLCWLESSFVGSKPSKGPETPSAVAENSRLATAGRDHGSVATATAAHRESYSNCSAADDDDDDWRRTYRENRPLDDRINERRPDTSDETGDPSVDVTDEAADHRGRSDEGRRQRDARPQQLQPQVGRATVRCEYPKCGREAEPAEAKRSFKVCHNCACAYCSRECRQQHWERHRKACLQSRASELCHRILEAIKADGELWLAASRLARRGFLERGRGCVKYYFHSPQLAEQFVAAASGGGYPEAAYVEWSRLEPHELGDELHSGLVRVCKSYNADSRLVVLVAVHVVAEAPSSGGCVKWERRIVFRYAKTKLSPQLLRTDVADAAAVAAAQPPATLVLTSLPGLLPTCRKQREVTFTNIQRQLRQRGVSLRKQFPDVYRRLCDYVEGDAFAPTTIYPVDAASAKAFMCVIMPDGEPRHVDLSPTGDDSRPRTVHVGRATAAADQSTRIRSSVPPNSDPSG